MVYYLPLPELVDLPLTWVLYASPVSLRSRSVIHQSIVGTLYSTTHHSYWWIR